MIKMKTTLLITLLLSMTVANAQEFELNEKGAYERQKVIQVEEQQQFSYTIEQ